MNKDINLRLTDLEEAMTVCLDICDRLLLTIRRLEADVDFLNKQHFKKTDMGTEIKTEDRIMEIEKQRRQRNAAQVGGRK